jgi:hypothetical protein
METVATFIRSPRPLPFVNQFSYLEPIFLLDRIIDLLGFIASAMERHKKFRLAADRFGAIVVHNRSTSWPAQFLARFTFGGDGRAENRCAQH